MRDARNLVPTSVLSLRDPPNLQCLPCNLQLFNRNLVYFLFSFSLSFLFFSLFFFDDQGVGGVETGPCSTTSTDLSSVSMNSYLERDFL